MQDQNPEAGMTIIEILIVIALIGTIMTVVITNLFPEVDKAKISLTHTAASNLSTTLQRYRMDNNNLPSTEEGLHALLEKTSGAKNWQGPYLEEDKINDAWQRPFQYERINGKQFKLISLGQDGEGGNEDDIQYPKTKEKTDEN